MKPDAHFTPHLRRLGILLAVSAAFLLAVATPARAETEPGEPKISHAAELCIELLEDGGKPEDCHNAPDPFFPPWQEIVWSVLGFSVVAFFLWKFGRPAIRKAMNARTERIRTELDNAEQARSDANRIRAEYQQQVANASEEVEAIILEGREQAARLRFDFGRTMQSELDATRARAVADMDAARTQAIADVRTEAGVLVAGLTEHLVRKNLDQDTANALIEDFIEALNQQN